MHSAAHQRRYLLYRTVLCLGDLHACVAKIMMDEKIDGVLGWSYPHIKVPNGIKPKFWITGSSENFDMKHRNAAMRDELSNGNPDAHLIVHVGRFSYEKKIMFLVPVIIELCKKYGDKVQFALVGWGPLLTPFCEAIANAGFADRIKAMNTLTGERLYQAYASSDIFFSPSCSEAFPIVFLEAMRSGLTCVAPCGPRAGGSQSTFKPGVHGYQCVLPPTDLTLVAYSRARPMLLRACVRARVRACLSSSASPCGMSVSCACVCVRCVVYMQLSGTRAMMWLPQLRLLSSVLLLARACRRRA